MFVISICNYGEPVVWFFKLLHELLVTINKEFLLYNNYHKITTNLRLLFIFFEQMFRSARNYFFSSTLYSSNRNELGLLSMNWKNK